MACAPAISGRIGFIHDVHQAVGNKVARLPLGVFDSGSSGRLSRMVTQEMMNLGESAAHFIFPSSKNSQPCW